jgi:mannan endo-1,4-beta-mannosidase
MTPAWDGELKIIRLCFIAIALCLLAGCGSSSDSNGTTAQATTSSPTASGGTSSLGSSTLLRPNTAGAPTTLSNSTARVARPGYNTGSGLFVLNGKLYDPNGNEFRIRGVNRDHWDSDSAAGIVNSGANTVRWTIDFTRDASANVSLIQTQAVQNSEVPVVGNWGATCSADPASMLAAAATWVAQASQWTQLNKSLIVNIANEWGPANSTIWRDSYIVAIASLRSAGYTGPIMVDSGGCGQDDMDLIQYSQAVFNSDPERNIIFALHLYGGTNDYSASIQSIQKGNPTVITLNSTSSTHPFAPNYDGTNNNYSGIVAYQLSGVQGMVQANGEQPAVQNIGGTPGAWTVTLAVDSTNWGDYTGGGTLVDYYGNYAMKATRLAALSQSTGAVYIIGEFGPGENIGPSPTLTTPAEIITAAEASNVGWLAWAWDDNDLAACTSDNNWFSMTYNCGTYNQASDLTSFGQDVVLNPQYGIKLLAKPASGL